MTSRSPLLAARGTSRRFGKLPALDAIELEIWEGEALALVGPNGAGKSTLLSILAGALEPSSGDVERLKGLRVGWAPQRPAQYGRLSARENLELFARLEGEPDPKAAAGRLLDEFDLPGEPAPSSNLSVGNRQRLNLAIALLGDPEVLLLDEPTTALGPEDVERLHALVLERSRAGVGIVYVSHRLPEVLGIADRITVLRDGVSQGTFDAAGMSEESLVALMIGRPLQLAFPERKAAGGGREVLLEVSGLHGDRFGPIDLDVAKGEILGIAGAEGNGQLQFLRALAGAEPVGGTATCNGRRLDMGSPLGPLRAGVVLLSGDRTREALFPVLSVRANTTIQVLRSQGRFGFLNRRRERRTVEDLVRRLTIRLASVEQPVLSLSGGNQQKVSLTRPFLRGEVSVILAEEPTQGVDVAARFDIYDALRAKAGEGVAIVVKSSDPLELAGLCDRVVVMSRGTIVDEIGGDDLGERRIVEAIVGTRATSGATEESPS